MSLFIFGKTDQNGKVGRVRPVPHGSARSGSRLWWVNGPRVRAVRSIGPRELAFFKKLRGKDLLAKYWISARIEHTESLPILAQTLNSRIIPPLLETPYPVSQIHRRFVSRSGIVQLRISARSFGFRTGTCNLSHGPSRQFSFRVSLPSSSVVAVDGASIR